MSELSGKQRQALRGIAHSLQPVVRVGDKGLSETVMAEIEGALDRHELIKVKLDAERGARGELSEAIAERTGATLVGAIGRVVILYRQNPDVAKRRVEVPAG